MVNGLCVCLVLLTNMCGVYCRWVGNNPKSDLLTMLKAVGAFEYAGGDMDFCEKNLLRYKVCCGTWWGCAYRGERERAKRSVVSASFC